VSTLTGNCGVREFDLLWCWLGEVRAFANTSIRREPSSSRKIRTLARGRLDQRGMCW